MKKMVKITLVILVISVCSVSCLPISTRPLNERSTELAWQAWLLVDDQNQNRHESQGTTRRRITPKSVFIAPTFSPDTLPACAEGYRSDSMGRCIKIIKLDEDAHLDFLLQKLNEKFGEADYEDELEEVTPSGGPFQFNIPLEGNSKSSEEHEDEEEDAGADVAIVVAPSTIHSNQANNSIKIDVKRHNQTQPSVNAVNVQTIAHILGVRQEEVETTTIYENSTPSDATTTFGNQDENTASTHFTDGTTTYTETTMNEGDGLFYLNNPTTEPQQTYGTNTEDFMINEQGYTTLTTITTDITDQSTEDTTTFDASTQPISTIAIENYNINNDNNQKTKEIVKFPEDIESEGSSSDYVKFPENIIHQENINQFRDNSNQVHNVRDTKKQTQELFREESILGYVPSNIETSGYNYRSLGYIPDASEPLRHGEHHLAYNPESSEFSRHRETQIPESSESLRHSERQRHYFQRQYPGQEDLLGNSPHPHLARHPYNHRNRDRHNDLFVLPPSVRDVSLSSQQKPIVLRFTRKHGYLDIDSLKSPQFYRQLPPGELSNLFGFRPQNGHR